MLHVFPYDGDDGHVCQHHHFVHFPRLDFMDEFLLDSFFCPDYFRRFDRDANTVLGRSLADQYDIDFRIGQSAKDPSTDTDHLTNPGPWMFNREMSLKEEMPLINLPSPEVSQIRVPGWLG